ncbi:hypothetical protein [Pseudogemmobacter sonorensis]|uniref:hypothetical protein n=1 Tax=Pseudogemmobacter sonorensis TaxID=2989681 RepID=UPI0036A152D7
MEVLSETRPKARRAHICDHCGCAIAAGEKYQRAFLKDGGETWPWKSHLDCAALCGRMHADQDLSWDEGINLSEEWGNDRDEMLRYRDEFPAVIARFESRARRADEKGE